MTPVEITGHVTLNKKKIRLSKRVEDVTDNRTCRPSLASYVKDKHKKQRNGRVLAERIDEKLFSKLRKKQDFVHVSKSHHYEASFREECCPFEDEDAEKVEDLSASPSDMRLSSAVIRTHSRRAIVEPVGILGSTLIGKPKLSRSTTSDYLSSGRFGVLTEVSDDEDQHIEESKEWFALRGPKITDLVISGDFDWFSFDNETHDDRSLLSFPNYSAEEITGEIEDLIDDHHTVVSSINGANGEATGTDDLDNLWSRVVPLKSGDGFTVGVRDNDIGSIGCKCTEKNHYHVAREFHKPLTKAHRAFMKRKLKRDGPKSTSTPPSKENAIKMKISVFVAKMCKVKSCVERHLHIDDGSVRACSPHQLPFDEEVGVSDEDVGMDDEPIRTPQGEKNRTSPNVRTEDQQSAAPSVNTGKSVPSTDGEAQETFDASPATAPQARKDRRPVYASREDAIASGVSEGLLAGGLFVISSGENEFWGVVAVKTLTNDGILEGIPNSCFFITLGQMLHGLVYPLRVSDYRARFDNNPGTPLDLDIAHNNEAFNLILRDLDLTVYVWQAVPLDTALIYCSGVCGGGSVVRHMIAYEAHFEFIVGFDLCRLKRGYFRLDIGDVHFVAPTPGGKGVVTRECFERHRVNMFTSEFSCVRGPSFHPSSPTGGPIPPNHIPSPSLKEALLCMSQNGGEADGIFESFRDEFLHQDEETNNFAPTAPPYEPVYSAPKSTENLPSTQVGFVEFMPIDHFDGARDGFIFTKGIHGLGYYRDIPREASYCELPPSGFLRDDDVTIDGELVSPEGSPFCSFVNPSQTYDVAIGGVLFDRVRCVELYTSVSKLEQTSPGIIQSIRDSLFSYFYADAGFTLPESPRGIQGSKKINMRTDSRPTLLTKIITLGFAENMVTIQPESKVELLDKSYFSVSRGLIFINLADKLSQENNGIGSLVNGDFWSWSIPKMRAQAKAISTEYFSLKKHLDLRVDDHTEHTFVSVTMNTIAYAISNEVKNCSNLSMHMPASLGKKHIGRSSKDLSFGNSSDTFMGVIRANSLMRNGVGVGSFKGPFVSIITSHEKRKSGVYFDGLTRMLPSRCEKPLDWKFNGKYKVTKGFKFITPDHYISFPFDQDAELYDKMNYSHQYLTVYGFSFGHTGVIYGNIDRNISGMVERHWKTRTAEQQEIVSLPKYGVDPTSLFDERLMSAQAFFSLHFAERFVSDTRSQLGPFEYFTHTQEAASLLILEKHIKQRLRVDAYTALCQSGDIGNLIFVNYLVWKLKKMELAKFGKPARVIVDAQTGNSLPSVHISNAWKEHSANQVVVYFSCVSIEFCSSPSPKDLEGVFMSWDLFSYAVVIKNYSDDSIIGIWNRSAGRYDMYNTDIRGNDASHSGFSWSVFATLLGMSEEHRVFLFKMLFAKNYLYSRDKKSMITFQAKYGYLPSGIGETSIANNCAMLMIAWMLGKLIHTGKQPELSLVTYSAFRCGFLLSHEPFDLYGEFSKMQFLKNSPVRLPTGRCLVIPNLGRMLRYSGRSKSDVTTRAFPPPPGVNVFSWYQTLLTYGEFKKVDYPPLRRFLCPHFDLVSPKDYSLVQKLREDVYPEDLYSSPVLVSREVFYSRYISYGLESFMIDEFEYLVSFQDLGTIVYCSLVDIVLGADYGLSPASH